MIFASFLVYLAEKDVADTKFKNFAEALWWGVVSFNNVLKHVMFINYLSAKLTFILRFIYLYLIILKSIKGEKTILTMTINEYLNSFTVNSIHITDHAVHRGVRRHGPTNLAREVHSFFLRITRNIILCTPSCE